MTLALSIFAVTFGTSGARGLVTDITPAYCWTFTRAFLQVLGPDTRQIVIGHDLRPSSPAIAAACCAAAEAAGVAVLYAGAVCTPAIALAGQINGLAALMVTGSHIPADRNGIKAYRPAGEITKADEQAMLLAEVPDHTGQPPQPLPPPNDDIAAAYVRRYTSAFAPELLKGLRIAVYEHSTVLRDMLHVILRALGAETIGLGRSDGFLPVDTEAVRAEDHELARQWAKSHRFDAIVSADGDADRPLVGDENGQWLRGDVLGILSARALGARSVVTPVSSNTALELCGSFGSIVRTRIGSPYVIEAMMQKGLPAPIVGYEANGGFLLGGDVVFEGRNLAALPTRDAMLPIILVLAAARQQGCKLSELTDTLPQRFTHSDRLRDFAIERSRGLIAALGGDPVLASAILAPDCGTITAMDQTDGLRLTFASGDIVHLRPSGNAPELRCYAESTTPRRAGTLCRACLDRVALS